MAKEMTNEATDKDKDTDYIKLIREHDEKTVKLIASILDIDADEALDHVIPYMIGTKEEKNRCFGFTLKRGQPRCCLKIICQEDSLYCSKHLNGVEEPNKQRRVEINAKTRDSEILNIIIRKFELDKKETRQTMKSIVHYPKCSITSNGTHIAGMEKINGSAFPLCWEHKPMKSSFESLERVTSKKKVSKIDDEPLIRNNFVNPYIQVFAKLNDSGEPILVDIDGRDVSYSRIIKKTGAKNK